ncbi:MAG: hypothetical protein L6V85_04870 [Clostridiales bacterium]|nr:MAG: hypothetical protein L6V85_04870 [Clostridiales bacterium]
MKQSIEKIITPESVNISAYTYVVLAVSIVLKIFAGADLQKLRQKQSIPRR